MAATSRSLGSRALRPLWSRIAAGSLGTQAGSAFQAAQTRRLHVLSSGNSSAAALPAPQPRQYPRKRGKFDAIAGKDGGYVACFLPSESKTCAWRVVVCIPPSKRLCAGVLSNSKKLQLHGFHILPSSVRCQASRIRQATCPNTCCCRSGGPFRSNPQENTTRRGGL